MIKMLLKVFDDAFPLFTLGGVYIFSLIIAALVGRFDLFLLDLAVAYVVLSITFILYKKS
ncbi:MAG TPA: hypothetical protein ENF40_00385 [Thermoplasmatales archaeon]|nr:hypothetical protein [Thermoplasmatales archaeon]